MDNKTADYDDFLNQTDCLPRKKTFPCWFSPLTNVRKKILLPFLFVLNDSRAKNTWTNFSYFPTLENHRNNISFNQQSFFNLALTMFTKPLLISLFTYFMNKKSCLFIANLLKKSFVPTMTKYWHIFIQLNVKWNMFTDLKKVCQWPKFNFDAIRYELIWKQSCIRR